MTVQFQWKENWKKRKPKEQKEKEFYLFSVFIFITDNFISSDLMGFFFSYNGYNMDVDEIN